MLYPPIRLIEAIAIECGERFEAEKRHQPTTYRNNCTWHVRYQKPSRHRPVALEYSLCIADATTHGYYQALEGRKSRGLPMLADAEQGIKDALGGSTRPANP